MGSKGCEKLLFQRVAKNYGFKELQKNMAYKGCEKNTSNGCKKKILRKSENMPTFSQ